MPAAAGGHRHSARSCAATRADRWIDALRASVEYAFAHPGASRDYVASLAQEMDPDVTARHIQLYVNDYTRALDERAVSKMLEWGEQQGVFPRADRSVPAFVPAAAGA